MIVRRKGVKKFPGTEYHFRVSMEKKDVKSTLSKYIHEVGEKAPELVEGYIYIGRIAIYIHQKHPDTPFFTFHSE